jgi:phosphatidylglycerol:prolipoprotein diacylglycerol transferase
VPVIVPYGAAPGIVAAIQLLRNLARRANFNPDTIVDLALVTMVTGFSGARLFYVIQFWEHFRTSPLGIFKIWEGGLVLYGGIAGGLLGFSVFVQRNRLPFLACLDLFVIATALAQGFGRLGCFLNGCCFGRETKLFPGVSFPFLDHKIHPAQIYESVFCFALAGFLFWLWRRIHGTPVIAESLRRFASLSEAAKAARLLHSSGRTGMGSAAYFFIYAAGRFVVEFFRGDNAKLLFHLSLAQWISVILIVLSAFSLKSLIYGKQANRRTS